MRTIKLTGDASDYHRVYGVMVFPEDAAFRAGYLRMLIDQGRLSGDDEVQVTASWDLPRWEEIKAEARKSVRAGILAGDYLAAWSVMDAHGLRDPSSRRASQAVERFRRGAKYKDGVPFRATSRKVEGTDFVMHRNSAHLWAALQMVVAKHGVAARRRMHHPNGMRWFLRRAKYVQEFGLSQMTPRTNQNRRHALLDAATVWHVPPVIKPVNAADLPRFNAVMTGILRDYQRY